MTVEVIWGSGIVDVDIPGVDLAGAFEMRRK
jgi:hypothetical protein